MGCMGCIGCMGCMEYMGFSQMFANFREFSRWRCPMWRRCRPVNFTGPNSAVLQPVIRDKSPQFLASCGSDLTRVVRCTFISSAARVGRGRSKCEVRKFPKTTRSIPSVRAVYRRNGTSFFGPCHAVNLFRYLQWGVPAGQAHEVESRCGGWSSGFRVFRWCR